jgi:hypothetical protein
MKTKTNKLIENQTSTKNPVWIFYAQRFFSCQSGTRKLSLPSGIFYLPPEGRKEGKMRIKLTGYKYEDSKEWIMVEGKGLHKNINIAYINDDKKIKEMEDNGYAYCNRDKSLLQ